MLICFVLAGSQTISSVSSLSDGLKLVQFSKPLLWCFGSVGAVSLELGWMVDCYSLDLKDFAILVWVYSAYVQFRHETKICVGSCTELEDTTLQFSLPWEFPYMPSSQGSLSQTFGQKSGIFLGFFLAAYALTQFCTTRTALGAAH